MDTTSATPAELRERIRQLEAELSALKRALQAVEQKAAVQAQRDPRRAQPQ